MAPAQQQRRLPPVKTADAQLEKGVVMRRHGPSRPNVGSGNRERQLLALNHFPRLVIATISGSEPMPSTNVPQPFPGIRRGERDEKAAGPRATMPNATRPASCRRGRMMSRR